MSEAGRKRVRPRSGELRRVRCRVCSMELNFQAYSDHLEVSHPEEDPKDRRELGQGRLFGGVKVKQVEQVEQVEQVAQVEQLEQVEQVEQVGQGWDERGDDVTMEENSEAEVEDKEKEVIEIENDDVTMDNTSEAEVKNKKDEVEDEVNNNEEGRSMVDIKEVKDILKNVLEREGTKVNFDDCTTEEDKLNKCFFLVSKTLKVKEAATSLVKTLEELKLVEGRGEEENDEVVKETLDEDSVIRLAKSLEELTDVEVLSIQGAGKHVVCLLCDVAFKADQSLSNLRVSLRRHLKAATHQEKVKEEAEETVKEERWEARNRKIDKTVGGLVYILIYNGRPDRDLPKLIYRVKQAGGDVGDINHSHNLVGKLLPDIAQVVRSRIKKFMGSPMAATGSLPPCNITADKATDKRDSRHLIGILTLNPGGTSLFKAFFLGAPKCARGTGEELTASIVAVVDEFVTSVQYRGFTGDGVYLHTGVGDKLNKHFGRRGVIVHDLMHKAALTDTKMRNPDAKDMPADHKDKFAWLNTLTIVIGSSVVFIQWGLEWDNYFKNYLEMVDKGLEARVLRPKTFSETKMANHASAVYQRFREMVPALLRTLWQARIDYSGVGSGAEGAKKVEKATSLLNRVHNSTFLLSLSALVDIYNIYANISNVLQVVDILVFERLDIYDSNLEKLLKLGETVSTSNCCCNDYFDYTAYPDNTANSFRAPWVAGKEVEALAKEVCCWPVLHGDIREMLQTAMYRRVPVGSMAEESSQTRAGRRLAEKVAELNVPAVVKVVSCRADSIIQFLHSGLSKVYSGTDRAQIESIRALLNFQFFIRAVGRSGAANTAAIHFKRWLDSARLLQPELLINISMDELKVQFRVFLRKLQELTPTIKELKDKEVFSLLLHPRHGHYKGFESVLAILANASVAMGLESMVESWVSVMEHHNNPRRALTQARVEQECMVSINGPSEVHSDSVVLEALGAYWSRKKVRENRQGHWVRRDKDMRQYVVSEAVDSEVNQPPDVAFMV